MFGAAVYYVWQERNNRPFDRGTREVDALVQIVVETVKMRMMSFHVKESMAVLAVERIWKIKLKRSAD